MPLTKEEKRILAEEFFEKDTNPSDVRLVCVRLPIEFSDLAFFAADGHFSKLEVESDRSEAVHQQLEARGYRQTRRILARVEVATWDSFGV